MRHTFTIFTTFSTPNSEDGCFMNSKPSSYIITVGLAIFSMFFGAGNLIYPLAAGLHAGGNNMYGMIGFILTAVCLPLAGLIAMILFDGNYEAFFDRLGKVPGRLVILICMIVIGPMIAIPRIVTVSHTMIAPFLPIPFLQDSSNPQASFVFALIFLGITYLATYRENKIVDLLGTVISPLLVISLFVIIIKGFLNAHVVIPTTVTALEAFKVNFIRGYETLDLLGGIFFSSIVISILKNTVGDKKSGVSQNQLALIGLKAGTLGVALLALVYIGMSILSVYHGHNLPATGDLFKELSFRVLGNGGALIIATAVLMACFSTSIALGAVVGEYFQVHIFQRKISYELALFILMLLCIPLSTFGLEYVAQLTGGPLVYIGYPAIIMLTFCNIAYKLANFKPVKIPVAVIFIIALISYFQ